MEIDNRTGTWKWTDELYRLLGVERSLPPSAERRDNEARLSRSQELHGIVASHGGRIEATSRPGEGTRFDIFLPALGAERTAPKEMAA